MLTISQLAAYAGVTVKAVRHYHAKGLLPEPERDRSGYRRYHAAAVVELIRIRTLADAGVPLCRVRHLLAADDAEFQAAVEDIDRRLRDEIAQRRRHREGLRRLAAAGGLTLPPEALSYLDRLRQLGLPDRSIDMKRHSWMLIATRHPEELPALLAVRNDRLRRCEVITLYRDLDAALDWPPDDPRLAGLADRIDAVRAADEQADAGGHIVSEDLARLLDNVFCATTPYGHRLLGLLEERGWSGWTNARRIPRREAATC